VSIVQARNPVSDFRVLPQEEKDSLLTELVSGVQWEWYLMNNAAIGKEEFEKQMRSVLEGSGE
jgi:hypothetical protein